MGTQLINTTKRRPAFLWVRGYKKWGDSVSDYPRDLKKVFHSSISAFRSKYLDTDFVVSCDWIGRFDFIAKLKYHP